MQSENLDLDDILKSIGIGRFHFRFLGFLFFVAISQTMLTLSPTYLQQPLACVWKIGKTESAGIVTASFCGMLVGSIIFGSLSDKYGRTRLFYWSIVIVMYFTAVLIFTPTFPWTVALQLMSGFFLSGSVATIIILMTELFPIDYRETGVMVYSIFTCIGAVIISLLGHFVMNIYGWRYFIAIQVIPIVIVVAFMAWLPESPRYLLLADKKEQCLKVINQMAKMNGKRLHDDLPIDQTLPTTETVIFTTEICNRKSVKYISCVSLICFNCGLSYFAAVLLSNILQNTTHQCLENRNVTINRSSSVNFSDNSCCGEMNEVDFRTNIIASSSELPVLLMMWYLSRCIGRKSILILCNILIAASMFSLNFCYPYLPEISISIARGAAVSLFPINDLYGNEIFPTSIRGFAFGVCSVFTRFGSIISPFVVNKIFTDGWFFQGTVIFCVMNVVVAILAFIMLPETRHRKMEQTYVIT